MTDAQLRAQTQGWASAAWNATTDWFDQNKAYIGAGFLIVVGAGLMFTGVGGPIGAAMIGGALFSGGISMGFQKATTGNVNWATVGESALIGAAGGGVGAGVARGLGLAATSLGRAEGANLITTTGAKMLGNTTFKAAMSGGAGNAAANMTGYTFSGGEKSLGGYAETAGVGFATGAAGGAVSDVAVTRVGEYVKARSYVPQHAAGMGRHRLPAVVTRSEAVTRHVIGATGAATNTYLNGDHDPRDVAKSFATGLIKPKVAERVISKHAG